MLTVNVNKPNFSLLPGGDEPKVINEQHLYYNLGIGMAYIGDWKSCFEVMQKIINPNLYAKAAITRGKVKITRNQKQRQKYKFNIRGNSQIELTVSLGGGTNARIRQSSGGIVDC